MLLIQKATTNTDLILTLTENSTLTNPYYLFVFEKGGNTYPVILTDLATTAEKARFNKFTLIEGTNNPTSGQVILGGVGVYQLTVYEQSSSTNLDPDLATGRVEYILARVIDSESSIYVEHEIDVTYTEYDISI